VTAKFRHNTAVPLAAFVALIGASAVAFQRWWLLPILLVPLVLIWWGLRAGVDVDADSLRVRGLVGTRTLAWSDVTGFRLVKGRVHATLANGYELPLPAVTPAEVPALIEASGQTLESQ
jgi:hypothetical protein